jgi:hypothetical protein
MADCECGGCSAIRDLEALAEKMRLASDTNTGKGGVKKTTVRMWMNDLFGPESWTGIRTRAHEAARIGGKGEK